MTKTTYRNAKKEKFTPISNSLLSDSEASLQAKGLLPIFLSNKDDWNINMKEIINRSKNGRDAHYKTVNELIELGYFARLQVVDPVKKQFEEMIYLFSDVKQEVADEIENVKVWAISNGKDLIIEYKTKKDNKVKNNEKEPFTESQDADENPFTENQDTENEDTENQDINNTNLNNTNLNKEEEEVLPHSELISFLLSEDITLENAVKFEMRLLSEGLTGYTNEQVLNAIEWAIDQFDKGICKYEPYSYAVGRLKIVLDNKVKKVTNKPKQQKKSAGSTRKELLPDWFDEKNTRVQEPKQTQEKTEDDKKQEIERMLQELRS